MCGRYALIVEAEELAAIFGLIAPGEFAPRFNVAPSQSAPVVRLDTDGEREFIMLRWGLIPSFSRDGMGMINARSETVNEKRSFRNAFRERRCLVPATGFIEWQKKPGRGRKQPFHILLNSGDPFCFAGIWERWGDIETYAILTTEPNGLVAPIHDRMPVILPRNQYDAWLDPLADLDDLQHLLRPFDADEMTAQPIGTRINSPKNDDAACLEPVEPEPDSLFG